MRDIKTSVLPLAVVASLALLPGVSAAYVERGFAGAAAGQWSGGGKFIPGPPDGQCANMGAEGKVNLASAFGFSIPSGATITGVTAYIKAGAQGGQTIGVQLASNATSVPPTPLGSQRNIAVADADTGSCAETQNTIVNGTLANWGTPAPVLTPTIVNNPAFGLVFTKLEKSEVKVDAVCMEIAYTGSSTGVQESCTGSITNTIIVVKEVVGTPPDSSWEFNIENGDSEDFTLPASGGTKIFEGLSAATYTISEKSQPDGWTTSVVCTGGTESETSVVDVDFDAGAGAVVTCTFTNTAPADEQASITVKKVLAAGSPPPKKPWYFSFEGQGDFFLNAGAQQSFTGLAAGTYTIEELDTLGYNASVSCDNGDSGGSTVDVTVEDGDNVICTFTNKLDPTPIPTVGVFGLGALALMLAAVARRRMR